MYANRNHSPHTLAAGVGQHVGLVPLHGVDRKLAGLFELRAKAVLALAAACSALEAALAPGRRPLKAGQWEGGGEVAQRFLLALGLVQAVALAVDEVHPPMAVAVEVCVGLSGHCVVGWAHTCSKAKHTQRRFSGFGGLAAKERCVVPMIPN